METIPKKKSRFELKVFVLLEGSTGYVWNVILYTGGDTLLDDNFDSDYHATKVVLTLMEDLLTKDTVYTLITGTHQLTFVMF